MNPLPLTIGLVPRMCVVQSHPWPTRKSLSHARAERGSGNFSLSGCRLYERDNVENHLDNREHGQGRTADPAQDETDTRPRFLVIGDGTCKKPYKGTEGHPDRD